MHTSSFALLSASTLAYSHPQSGFPSGSTSYVACSVLHTSACAHVVLSLSIVTALAHVFSSASTSVRMQNHMASHASMPVVYFFHASMSHTGLTHFSTCGHVANGNHVLPVLRSECV